MKNGSIMRAMLVLALVTLAAAVAVAEEKGPSVAEQMKGLQAGCEASADARAKRHEAKSLYERLGGYDRILELTTEIVRLHDENDEIKHTLYNVDREMLAKHVADFMAAGIGGTEEYTGRALPAAHAHLELTDADFLSAGGDIVKAMTNLGYGAEEIDEVICILVSLKDQVVFE